MQNAKQAARRPRQIKGEIKDSSCFLCRLLFDNVLIYLRSNKSLAGISRAGTFWIADKFYSLLCESPAWRVSGVNRLTAIFTCRALKFYQKRLRLRHKRKLGVVVICTNGWKKICFYKIYNAPRVANITHYFLRCRFIQQRCQVEYSWKFYC